MLRLLDLHKEFISAHLRRGDTTVDFTMGNGHDTEFLSKAVGDEGRVYAFDIQESAIESTKKRLKDSGCPQNYTLIHDSHHNALKYVDGKIRAGMFNLGYLPGGDKNITTVWQTTMPAIRDAISMLGEDAILIVAVYPGHAEGDAEGKMIDEYLRSLSRFTYSIAKIQIINSPLSPYFFAIETR